MGGSGLSGHTNIYLIKLDIVVGSLVSRPASHGGLLAVAIRAHAYTCVQIRS